MGWSIKPEPIHRYKHGQKMWERACSRRRSVSLWSRRLIHRIREQARSHIWLGFSPAFYGACYTTNDSNMIKPSATTDRMVSIAVQVLNVSATVMLKYCFTSQNPASLT